MHPDLNNDGTTPRQWAGKYRDPDELERGYLHLQEMASKNWNELQELKAAGGERVSPNAQREARKSYERELEDLGVPPSAVRGLIEESLQEMLKPGVDVNAAREQVAGAFPNFKEIENDVADWVTSDSALQERYGRMFNADPAAAMEWAISAYMRAKSTSSPGVETNNFAEASLPPSGGSGPRNYDAATADEQYSKMIQDAQKSGDWNKIISQRLSGTVPDKHYDGLRY